MLITRTAISGLLIIDIEPVQDDRGHFARTYDAAAFAAAGIEAAIAECSTSFNRRAGTLRGMHYQAPPDGEVKLVRCTRGAIHDVALDLREGSPTCRQWHAVTLSEDNGRALLIPDGCAHGFQTLRDASEVLYQISVPYQPQSARGVRWDDPAFGIEWPAPPAGTERIISARDAALPSVSP